MLVYSNLNLAANDLSVGPCHVCRAFCFNPCVLDLVFFYQDSKNFATDSFQRIALEITAVTRWKRKKQKKLGLAHKLKQKTASNKKPFLLKTWRNININKAVLALAVRFLFIRTFVRLHYRLMKVITGSFRKLHPLWWNRYTNFWKTGFIKI